MATAGAWAPYRNGTMPREASPCGEVVAREKVLLLKQPERAFPALLQAEPGIGEGLLAPFQIDGAPVGTLWVIKRNSEAQFDAEDARLLQSLARFAAAGRQTVQALEMAGAAGQRAEAAFRDSEARYQALFAASPVPFMVLASNAPDFTITAANDAYFAATRTTRESLFGRRLFDVFPDDPSRLGQPGSEALAISLDHVMTTRTTDAMERVRYDLSMPDGGFEPHWWEAINAPMLDGSGKIIAIIHQVTRVTELHYREQAELKELERQAFLLRLSDALRPLGDAVDVQGEATRLLGEQLGTDRCYYFEAEPERGRYVIHRDYLRGERTSLAATYPFEDWPDLTAAFQHDGPVVIADTGVTNFVEDNERERVEVRDIHALLIVPLVKKGRFVAALAVAQAEPRAWTSQEVALVEAVAERTWAAVERARAEAALRESEAKYRTLFHKMQEGFSVLERVAGEPVDYRYLAANPAFKRHTGLSNPVGRTIRELTPGVEDSALESYRSVEETGVTQIVVTYVPDVGRWFEVDASSTEQPGQIAVLFRDVTERKRAEIARRESEERQAFLLELADRLREAGGATEAMAASAEMFGKRAGLAIAHFLIFDPDEDSYTLGAAYSDGRLPGGLAETGRLSDHGPEWAPQLRAGEALFSDDHQTRSQADAEASRALGVRSSSAVPLIRAGRMVAIFSSADPQPRCWTEAEKRLQLEVAERTWAAVERARAEASAREAEGRYLALFNAIDQGFCTIQVAFGDNRNVVDYRFLEVSPSFERQTGIENAAGRWMREIAPDQEQFWFDTYGRVALTGEPARFESFSTPLDRWWSVYAFKIEGVARIAVLFHDITDRKRAEAALRESEQRLRLIVENARDYAIFTTDTEGLIDDWRKGAELVLGWSPEEAVGQTAAMTFTPEDREEGVPNKEMRTARVEGRAPNDRWHIRKDGRRVFIEGIMAPLKDTNGTLTGFLKIGQDMTERHRADERQRLLLAELQHRVRNIIATIRSIARRTSETADSTEDYAQHLEGRINAMARTQAILTRVPGRGVNLETIVREEMLSVAASDREYWCEGPEVLLELKAAEVFTLAIHELATNAVKYGALSQPQGQLEIGWKTESRGPETWLVLNWEESRLTGAVVSKRQGFGTELITRRVPYELGGSGSLDLQPDGIKATIEFPLRPGMSILETGTANLGGDR